MKLRLLAFVAPFALVAACASSSASTTSDQDEVKRVVESFFTAADNHHLSRLNEILHPEFRLVVTRPDMPPQTLDKQEFMALMMTKIIGGKPRTIEDIATRVSGDRALSHVKLEGPYANFDAMQTFVREGNQWALIHSLTQYDPKS
ncbi:MAG: nuclear transport factor 2 family protein [Myxococcota bacterium]